MDVFLLEAVVQELQARAGRSRIDRIHQPEPGLFTFRLWNGRERLLLLLQADPGQGRLHFSEGGGSNPAAPHRFCQLLRARARRIEEISQLPAERVVQIRLLGPEGRRSLLVAEFLGAATNLVFVEEDGRIVDTLWRRPAGTARSLLPGETYAPPPSGSKRLLSDSQVLDTLPGEELETPPAFRAWLLKNLKPMSPLVATVLANRVERGDLPEEALEAFRRSWLDGSLRPVILPWGDRERPAALPPAFAEDLDVCFSSDSPSAVLEAFFGQGREVGGERLLREKLVAALRKQQRRLAKRLGRLAEDEVRLGRMREFQRWGELLMAHGGDQQPGKTQLKVTDWYRDPPGPVTVPLDPKLGPRQNAALYFRRAAKGRRGEEPVAERRQETLREIDWLDSVGVALQGSQTLDELREIEAELTQEGLISAMIPSKKAPGDGTPAGIGRTLSPGGFELLWGRNNRANDHLLRHLSGPEDLWFHAYRVPGRHLLLRTGGMEDIPEADLEFAASLAAGGSKAAKDTAVEVMIALRKKVRKVKGLHPGQVRVDEFRTIRVAPRRLN